MNTIDPVARRERLSRLGILEEPMGYVDGQNLYQFVGSSPTDRLDPTGLEDDGHGSVALGYAEQLERAKAAKQAWRVAQKQRLGAALAALCPQQTFTNVDNCNCTQEDCKAQAQKIADAIVDAVYKERMEGDQLGGNLGNLTGGNQCGDWQVIVSTAANSVINKYKKTKNNCFEMTLFEGKGDLSQHQWTGIGIGPNMVIIDPWPSGGKGNLDDSSATGGWKNVKSWPTTPSATRPSTPQAPANPVTPATQPSTGS